MAPFILQHACDNVALTQTRLLPAVSTTYVLPCFSTSQHQQCFACCRLLLFCANMAACLPFKRCDEPYTLLHLINSVISRRGAFVLSAQKASLDSAHEDSVKPAAANGSVQQPQSNNTAESGDNPQHAAAVSGTGRKASLQENGEGVGARPGSNTEAGAAEQSGATPSPDVDAQVSLLPMPHLGDATQAMTQAERVHKPMFASTRHLTTCDKALSITCT